MSSRTTGTKLRRLQQLKDNVGIRLSLLLRQAHEFQFNLQTCVLEVKNNATQVMSSAGQEHTSVQQLQDMLKKLDRRTDMITKLNSILFDMLEENGDEEEALEEDEGSRLSNVAVTHQLHDELQAGISSTSQTSDSCASSCFTADHQFQPEMMVTRDPQPRPDILPVQPSVVREPRVAVSAAATSFEGASALPPTLAERMSPPVLQPITVTSLPSSSHQHQVTEARLSRTVLSSGEMTGGGNYQQPADFVAPYNARAGSASVTHNAVPCQAAWSTGFSMRSLHHALLQSSSSRPDPPRPLSSHSSLRSQIVDPVSQTPVQQRSVTSSHASQHPPGSRSTARQDGAKVAWSEGRQLGQDKLTMGDCISSVMFTFIENPWSFYVVKCQDSLQQLNSEINNRIEALCTVKPTPFVGMLCIAQYTDHVFYRARVDRLYPDDMVGVYFVDYGNVFVTEGSSLLILPDKLRDLPGLAIHCCLSGVMSSSKTGMWTQKSMNTFRDLVSREVICKPVVVPEDGSRQPALVDLLFPSSTVDDERSINRYLVEYEMARPIDNKELLAKLASSSRRLPDVDATNPPPSTCPSEVSDSTCMTVVQHAQVKTDLPPVDAMTTKSENVLSQKQLENILRRVQNYPRNFSKKNNEHFTEIGDSTSLATSHTESSVKIEEVTKDLKEVDGNVGNIPGEYYSLLKELIGGEDFCSFSAMAATVNSPTDFYVHRVCEETASALHDLETYLNKAFSAIPKPSLRLRSRKLDAKPGALCCAQFRDSSYCRGLILDIKTALNSTLKQVKVFFMDHGDTEWVSRSSVYTLPNHFHHIAPQAVWCSLAYVKPLLSSRVSDGEDDGREWDRQAVQQFEQLVGENKVVHVLTAGPLPQQNRSAADVQKEPLLVFLEDVENNLCINHDLIIQNFAASKIPEPAAADEDDVLDSQEGAVEDKLDDDTMWNDMIEDSKSLLNTYGVDVTDAGVIMTGVKAKGGQRGRCRFYNTPSGCHKGNKCHYLHVEKGMQRGVSDNLKQVAVFDEDQTALLPCAGTVVSVEVSSVRTPALFYVTLPWGPFPIRDVASNTPDVQEYMIRENLGSLNAAMATHYKGRRLDGDYSVYAPGQAVAAWSHKSGSWFRAKVIDVEPDQEMVLVMFVDFGDVECVPEKNIRQLDPRFLFLPPQAVECCLVDIRPPAPHQAWPDSSRSEFFKLVCGKTLVAFVRQRMRSGRLSVELFDTSHQDEDVNIGDVLIQRGLAEMVKQGSEHGRLVSSHEEGDDQEIAEDGDVTYFPG